MKVLYIDGVGPFGGASRSLFEVIRALPAGEVAPHFLVQRGTILDFYGTVASDVIATRGVTRFDNTRYGHYRGGRWLVVFRELAYIPFMLAALARARLRWRKVDLIHANEVTEIIPSLLAKRLFGAPLVVHVRSLQRTGDSTRRSRWLHAQLRLHADAVIAIDENVRMTLPADLPAEVIHNSFTPQHAAMPDEAMRAALDAIPAGPLRVGFIGNLHVSKGLLELLEAARLVRESGRHVEFVIVGGGTRVDRGLRGWLLERLGLAQNLHEGMTERIARYDLAGTFHLLGATSDIQCVYERIDVLCFPSHFDAPGRPVFEAAFSGVPAIVAVTQPREDTLSDGETGLAVPGKDPVRLAEAISYFADNRAEVSRMGAAAQRLAVRNFHPPTNATKLLALYRRVLAARPRS